MSQLADLLEAHFDATLKQWTALAHAPPSTASRTAPELAEHLPGFLRQIITALRQPPGGPGQVDAPRWRDGFALAAVVRESGLLLQAMLDLAERHGVTVAFAELRRLNALFTQAVAAAAAEYARREVERLAHDETAARTQDAELRTFRTVVEASTDFIAFGSPDGHVAYINPAGMRMVGIPNLEFACTLFVPDFFGPETREASTSAILQATAAGQPFHGNTVLRHFGTGEDIWVSQSTFTVNNSQGKPLVLATIIRDRREQQRTDGERERLLSMEAELRRDAEQANRTKDEFLAMLGHELRNPLAPITTALHLLKLRPDAELAKELVVIERQVDHLTRLVDDLLDISRITSGKIKLSRQRVEMSVVVASAIEIASPLLELRQHHLTLEVPPRGLAMDADPLRLAQAISNVLANAAKYTDPGGRIAVTASRDGDQIVLRVKDDGVGIAPDMLPRVFDLFVQERQSSERARGGLGLGLSIVRTLVTMHGGTVSAHSEGHGRGSEFRLSLPALFTPPVLAESSSGTPRAKPVPAKGKGQRVLIVDDNLDAADLLAMALKLLGYETLVTGDGPSALALVAGFHPDFALLDIGLPVMDGYELARLLRQIPALGRLKLIAITGYGQDSDRKRSAEAGFDVHLVKPVQIAHLKKLLSGTD